MPNCRGAYAPQGVQPEAHGGRPALPAGSAHSNAPSLSPHFAAGGPITAFLLYRQNFNIFLQRLQGKSAGDLTIFLRYIIIISKKAALRQMGERKMADISVMDAERLCGWLPRRARETHKGDFGRILLLCGAVGYTGAPALAAMAAARSGAGLIFVGVPEPVYPIVAGKLLEPMVFPLPAQGGMLAESAVPEILARLSGCDACLIGCGLGRSAGTFAAVQAVLANASCPVVVDADGINVLEGHIDVLRGAACPVVLTPHDGEYRRLMGRLPGEDRMGAAAALAEKTGATVLLKGHRTAICGADERWENRCGNPGLATGGSGDVLAGILVSLLGQGLPPVHAAAAAAWLHGTAADRCAARMGEYGLLPSDVAAELPYLLP